MREKDIEEVLKSKVKIEQLKTYLKVQFEMSESELNQIFGKHINT